jgi:hypothetical protein
MKTIILILMMSALLFSQNYKVVQVKGDVKFQTGTSEEWNQLKEGTELNPDNFISTGEKSSVQIKGNEKSFSLGEMSAMSLGSIKTMSTDELLLALAMENMINAPKNNGKNSSNSTATYGEQETGKLKNESQSNDFGIKRLNGAMQLAKSGMKESSIVFAKETYRKYPDSKNISSYRIFFADILYEKGLFEEALSEYFEIDKLELSKEEKTKVKSQINSINKILLNE